MSDADALRAAILRDPADDVVRLAFADEIEASEPEWAALIRRQVYRSAGQPVAYRRGRLAIRRLFRPWWPGRSRWTPYNPTWDIIVSRAADPAPESSGCFFVRRGFVDEVRCPLQSWLAHGPAIVKAHPVTVVRLSDREPDWNGGTPRRGETVGTATWFRQPGNLPPGPGFRHHLPAAVFDRLPGGRPPLWLTEHPHDVPLRDYPDPQAAIDALSAALLALAKSPA